MMKKVFAISVIASVLVLPACTSSSEPVSPSASPAFCDSVTALETSLQSLKSIDVVGQGTDALQASVDEVKASLEAVVSSAQDLLGPDIQAVQGSMDALQASIDKVKGGTPLTQEAANILTELTAIQQAAEGLAATAKDQGCTT